jgi:uncharacterized protein
LLFDHQRHEKPDISRRTGIFIESCPLLGRDGDMYSLWRDRHSESRGETLLSVLSFLVSEFSLGDLAMLIAILAASAVMSGLSGFGFSAIGALSLCVLPPLLAVPLLMTLSSANQIMSLGQLKADFKPLRDWWPDGPAPYLLGGMLGVPLGLLILHSLPTTTLMAIVGGFLIAYAAYSTFKPESLQVPSKSDWRSSALVGMSGGIIGGFTAFPGAAVVAWSGLRRLPKRESRSVVQPYVLGLQLLSLALLALQRPATFDRTYWGLLAITLPVVLPCTRFGVSLYKSLSDINFRRITFMLLGISGAGLIIKAVVAVSVFAVATPAAAN